MGWRCLLTGVIAVACAHVQAAAIYKFVDASGVVNYTDRVTPGARRLVFEDRMVESLATDVRLNTRRAPGSVTYEAQNDLYAPVQVELRLSGMRNVAGVPPRTIGRLIPPRTKTTLITLTAAKAGQAIVGTPSFHYALGDPSLSPGTYRYPFPWVGGPFRISQGANGTFSHTGPKGRYALDIAMPEGTPIIAARQ